MNGLSARFASGCADVAQIRTVPHGFDMSRDEHLDRYSLHGLLTLLASERGDSVRLQVGFQPVFTLKGLEHEIEGPSVSDSDIDDLLRAVAGTRTVRELRRSGAVDLVHTFGECRFLVSVSCAFGVSRVDVRAVRS